MGNSTFEMVGGSLEAKNGGMFYTTNTESTFILSDVDITYAPENDFFLKCTGDSSLSSLQCAGTIVDASGNAVTIMGTDGTVHAQGTSAFTVTVGTYSATADASGAASADSWDAYKVAKP